MNKEPILLLSAALLLAAATPLSARTWTDTASGRTLEGDYVESDATHVVIKAGVQTHRIDIARLSEADREFIAEQAATTTTTTTATATGDPGAGPLAVITPPVSVTPLSVEGKGKSRKAEIEVINNGDQAISRLTVGVALFGEDGSVKKTVPHTTDGYFGKRGKTLGKGQDHVIELTDFWIKDDIASVAGTVKEVTWEDGTRWPAWTGPAPKQEGDAPVSLVMKGVLGEGDFALPLIEAFNHSGRVIKGIDYRIHFLDGDGNELAKKRWGEHRYPLEPGQGMAMVGSGGPPEGTEDVEFSLEKVTYQDDPGIAAYTPLTAEQIKGRKDVIGGNWTVSFDEERYLGFVFTERAKDGTRSLTYHWSEAPSLKHEFHYDHHEAGDDHELTFSPARAEEGESTDSSATCRFSDPEHGHGQRMTNSDLEFRPAAPRIGKSVRGPITLYSLEASLNRIAYDLMIVFVEDTAAAEEGINRVYGSP